MFEPRLNLVPIGGIEDDGDCGTWRQRATHRRIGRSLDDPCPVGSGFQRNLCSGQSDHRPRFGPFPWQGRRRWGWAYHWAMRSRRSSRGLSLLHFRTTHEECGAGEDADVVFRTHRLMLL